jgi:hypothetical protein
VKLGRQESNLHALVRPSLFDDPRKGTRRGTAFANFATSETSVELDLGQIDSAANVGIPESFVANDADLPLLLGRTL